MLHYREWELGNCLPAFSSKECQASKNYSNLYWKWFQKKHCLQASKRLKKPQKASKSLKKPQYDPVIFCTKIQIPRLIRCNILYKNVFSPYNILQLIVWEVRSFTLVDLIHGYLLFDTTDSMMSVFLILATTAYTICYFKIWKSFAQDFSQPVHEASCQVNFALVFIWREWQHRDISIKPNS